MPEDLSNLHILGVTDAGDVVHTIRRADDTWVPFSAIPGLPGPALDVACVRRYAVFPETAPATEGLLALIVFENDPPQLKFRNSDTGVWSTIGAGGQIPLPIARRAAITISPGVAPDNDPQEPGAQRAYIHMAVIADGIPPNPTGRIIAAVMPNRGTGGSFSSPTPEVQTSGAGDLGSAQAIALAPSADRASQESVALLAAIFPPSEGGSLFFSTGGVEVDGTPGGKWSPFLTRALPPPVGPGALPGLPLDIDLVRMKPHPTITDSDEYMTIVSNSGGDLDIYGDRKTSSGWGGWKNFELILPLPWLDQGEFSRVSLGKTTGGVHVTGVANGQLLHQFRGGGPSWFGATFRDVEQLVGSGELANFVAVASG